MSRAHPSNLVQRGQLLILCIRGGFRAVPGREGVWDVGEVRVQTLDWNSPSDIQGAEGPFNYVLAADCVYHEEHVEPLCRVVSALTDLKSTGVPPCRLCSTLDEQKGVQMTAADGPRRKVTEAESDCCTAHASPAFTLMPSAAPKVRRMTLFRG